MTRPAFPRDPVVLSDVALEIDPHEVLRFQGYKKGVDTPGADVLALVEEALAIGRALMAPRAVVRWTEVRRQVRDVIEVEGATLTIPDIERQWGPLESLAASVCTIGAEMERRVGELWEARELPLAVMLDSVASGAVESLAEYVNDELCQAGIARGVKVTNRISPGYGRWDLSEQRRLWELCPGTPIGVSLNEACFMTPAKSITLLAGAGREARVDHYFTQCARCWMPNCAYRRAAAPRTVRRAGR